jgi:hypothetical protein
MNRKGFRRMHATLRNTAKYLGNLLTNSCVTFAKNTLRAAGLEPPLWAVSGASLTAWARLIG